MTSQFVGLRVVRGPDWKWDVQDGGDGHLGTVVEVGSGRPVSVAVVHWDRGLKAKYRTGAESAYDLRIFDNAPCGVRHEGVSCDSCNTTDIAGMRWKCAVCRNFDLCTACYMSDQHDTSHAFIRHTTNGDTKKVQVPTRKDSAKQLLQGLLPGATVVRSKDWQWAAQGGENKTGVVVGIADFGAKGVRDAVIVRWGEEKVAAASSSGGGSSSVAYSYRVGHGGKVDVQYTVCASGGHYYPDHLPNVGAENRDAGGSHQASSGARFAIGDRVKCELEVGALRETQKGHGEWDEGRMSELRGQVGIVRSYTPTRDVLVEYCGQKKMYPYNPGALTRVEPFKLGDCVKIESDPEKVKACQDGHGGWVDGMLRLLGRVGKIVLVFPDGDLRVRVKGVSVVLNPLCCSVTVGKGTGGPPSSGSSDGEDLAGKLLRCLGSGELAGAIAAAASAASDGSSKGSRFKVGDTVKVITERDRAKELQAGHGGWIDYMENVLGKMGKVVHIHGTGDVRIKVNSHKWTFHPDCLVTASDSDKAALHSPSSSGSSSDSDSGVLSKDSLMQQLLGGVGGRLHRRHSRTSASAFDAHDIVTVTSDESKAKELQSGHGEWVSSMTRILGKTGKVLIALPTGDLRVKVNGRKWTLNPACCTLASNAERAAMAAEASQSSSESSSDAEESSGLLSALLGGAMGMVGGDRRLVNAVMQEQVSEVRDILSMSHKEVNTKVAGKTALQIAAHRGNIEIMLLLLDAGADFNAVDDDGDTAVHYAMFGSKPEAVQLLAGWGARLDVANKRGHTALHILAGFRDEDSTAVDVLLKCEGSVNKQDEDGDTALHCAIEKGYRTIIVPLVDHPSTDLTLKNNRGFNVLHHAVLRGDNFTVRMIITKLPRLVDERNGSGLTALHMAAVHGHRDVVETLLKEGRADVELLSTRHQTPLLLAVSHGHKEVADLLLDSSANIAAQDEEGDTCLHLAIAKHQLLFGTSASTAPSAKSLDLIRRLLEAGANQTIKNHKGESAADIATGPHTRALLEKYRQSQ